MSTRRIIAIQMCNENFIDKVQPGYRVQWLINYFELQW